MTPWKDCSIAWDGACHQCAIMRLFIYLSNYLSIYISIYQTIYFLSIYQYDMTLPAEIRLYHVGLQQGILVSCLHSEIVVDSSFHLACAKATSMIIPLSLAGKQEWSVSTTWKQDNSRNQLYTYILYILLSEPTTRLQRWSQ